MGLDLTLCFDISTKFVDAPEPYKLLGEIDFRLPHEEALLYSRLRMSYTLHEAVKEAVKMKGGVVKSVEWYGDEGLEVFTTNPYGNPLEWTTAGSIVRVSSMGDQPRDLGVWDKAVVAMLADLPEDLIVYVWWS